MTMASEWTYDRFTDTHFYGTQSRGAGIYKEDGQWMVNIARPLNVELFDGFATLEAAKAFAEAEVAKIEE